MARGARVGSCRAKKAEGPVPRTLTFLGERDCGEGRLSDGAVAYDTRVATHVCSGVHVLYRTGPEDC